MTGGIFGICGKTHCLEQLFMGTFNLQDRGQEYCGLATAGQGEILIRTHRGLVGPTFEYDLQGLESCLGMGATNCYERQPFWLDTHFGEMAVAFDGYLLNSRQLRDEIKKAGIPLRTRDQVEIVATLIAQGKNIIDGITETLQQIKGACSLVVISQDGIYAARDTMGMKPLILAKGDNFAAVASESSAYRDGLYNLNFTLDERDKPDVKAGEIIFIDRDGEIYTAKQLPVRQRRFCFFEHAYFAGPTSCIEGTYVSDARHTLGNFIGILDKVEADIVGAVPNSGICYREGYSIGRPEIFHGEIFLPLREGSKKALRTYITPDFEERKRIKDKKLTAFTPNVKGKRVTMVDDSIRSGLTSEDLVNQLKAAGAVEVHGRIGTPPSKRDCPWARPPKEGEGFIATKYSLEEISDKIGTATLVFQDFDNVHLAVPTLNKQDLCLDCFLKDSGG